MNTANLELCKELYELSNNENTARIWWDTTDASKATFTVDNSHSMRRNSKLPAYNLHELLDILPGFLQIKRGLEVLDCCLMMEHVSSGYAFFYHWLDDETFKHVPILIRRADTPEDAACKLTIALFEQGILKRKGEK